MISAHALGPLGCVQRPQELLRGCFKSNRREPSQALLWQRGLRQRSHPCAFNHRQRPGQQQPGNPFGNWEQQRQGSSAEQQPWQPPPASAAAAAGVHSAAGGGGGADEPSDGRYASASPTAGIYASSFTSGSSSPSQTRSLEDSADGYTTAAAAATKAGRLGGGGGGADGPPSAKQLLAHQLHSVETIEPSLGSLEDYNGFDTLEDGRADASGGGAAGVLHGKQAASVATFEVLRVDASGQVRRVHVRRRDLLREHVLQPRDLRRVDPSVDVAKTSPSIAVKENVLLVNLGGVRCGCLLLVVLLLSCLCHLSVGDFRAVMLQLLLHWQCSSRGGSLPYSMIEPAAGPTNQRNPPTAHPPIVITKPAGQTRRAIVTAEKALFFEPSGVQTRRLLDLVIPRLQASAGARLAAKQKAAAAGGGGDGGEADMYMREANGKGDAGSKTPFELEVLEGVLMVTTGAALVWRLVAVGWVGLAACGFCALAFAAAAL